jgi:beta-phosphoglucomutase
MALLCIQIGAIIELFDTISDGTNITHSKPDPEVFQIAAFSMRENPKDCLVVEDATVGIEAGKKGGFITASIGTAIEPGFGDYHLGAFAELIDICGNSQRMILNEGDS